MRDRIIFVHGPVETGMADTIVGQLLLLEAEDPHKDITMYINSPGGEVMAGLAIANTMNYIKCDVRTVAMGMACSMGCFLLSLGAPGKRCALEDAQIMAHQVSSGTQGKIHDMKRSFDHSIKLNDVYDLFDKYCEEGGSQLDFYQKVYMGIFQVSGFFTPSMMTEMQKGMEEIEK